MEPMMIQNYDLRRAIASATTFIQTNSPDEIITIAAVENQLLSSDQYHEVIEVHQQTIFIKGLRAEIKRYLKTLRDPETLATQRIFPGFAPPTYVVNTKGNEFIYIPLHKVNRYQFVNGTKIKEENLVRCQAVVDDDITKLAFGDFHGWGSNPELTWGEIEAIIIKSLPAIEDKHDHSA
jgi:hypothetical protein